MGIRRLFTGYDITYDAPMAERTTFRVGGPADALLRPRNQDELRSALTLARENNIPLTLIGNGSNLLVRDGGIRGLVIQICQTMDTIEIDSPRILAGAGATLRAVSLAAYRHHLAGMEFAAGIPGTLGGAVCMNAGAYGGEMSQIVRRVSGLQPDGTAYCLKKDEMEFSYRHSRVMEEGWIVLEVELELCSGSAEEIDRRMQEYANSRKQKQPLHLPSAGSAFKRPEGHYAGQLIEQAGLKGYSIGGAQVSEKHAGFIVNRGGATAKDIEQLLLHIQNVVYRESGIRLEPEIRILGDQ